jgi:O-antigen/teichoic acid export membrane protein
MSSDRWALQHFVSTEDVGRYAVLFQLGYTPINLITGMMITFLAPVLYQRSGSATDPARNRAVHRISWRIASAGLLMTFIGFILTLLLHRPIFHLLAADYQAVSYLLPWMVLAGGVFAAGQMLSLKLMSEIKSTALIASKIGTAVLGVGLNIYGAAQFGLQGVVAALVLFSFSYLIWMAWLARYAFPEHHSCTVKMS